MYAIGRLPELAYSGFLQFYLYMYAAMPLPGSLTNKPIRVNSQGLEGCGLTSGSRPVFPAHP